MAPTTRTTPVRATYRLQLSADLDLHAAAALAPQLAALGVSHVYASPILQAVPGSSHGYDVADPTRVSDELGGDAGWRALVAATRRHGLGLVVDVVPNHMAADADADPWWRDVLRHGRASPHARWFDVQWEAGEGRRRGRVLLPVLADHYGLLLDEGRLRLERADDEIVVRIDGATYPIDPVTVAPLLRGASPDRDPDRVDELLRALDDDPDAVDALLEQQHYRLAHWRTAGTELNYRRFFDVTDLVGVRVEEPDVFAATHRVLLAAVAAGEVDGLRIDHPDGLRDPGAYLRRLRAEAPHTWIVVEKILDGDEELPADWPVDGTTGYEALDLVGRLFVHPDGREPLVALATGLSGESPEFGVVAAEGKALVLETLFGAELEHLTTLFLGVCEQHRRTRDVTRPELAEVLAEVLTSFPVYRTYVGDDGTHTPADVEHVDRAITDASKRRPDLDDELFETLRLTLLGPLGPGHAPDGGGADERELRARFQQLTPPVLAKGVEDTALYRWLPLLARNEVGANPERFAIEPTDFHRACRRRHRTRPASMLALSTHDTKRSEDVRARLALLSEIPVEWRDAVRRWQVLTSGHRRSRWPDRAAEYLWYQTLVGAHPLPADRALPYLRKAIREAKRHTSWLEPDPVYEDAVLGFAADTLSDDEFTADLAAFVAPLVGPGRTNAVSQKLVQLTMPGVPDVYRGTEVWDLSLVDPDNRRPVPYDRIASLLAEPAARGAAALADLAADDEGRGKLHVVRTALDVRRRLPDAFGPAGDHRPVRANGARNRHVVAFARDASVITVVPRLVLGLDGGWGATSIGLPPGGWVDVLAPDDDRERHVERIAVGRLLERRPVALLVREDRWEAG